MNEQENTGAQLSADGAETSGNEGPASAPPVGVAVASGDEPSSQMKWYVLKVQSGREDSIRESLERRVAVEGVKNFFGQIVVPTEKVSEIKGGKRRVSERKLFPGYVMIQMIFNDQTWFLVRETPGVGDFAGAVGRPPVPMPDHEVVKMLSRETAMEEAAPRLKIDFHPGETVKVKEGTFENFEGTVESVDEASGKVTVMINIFGRSCPVELEYSQLEGI
ncbi:MAG: transcription termination/antitermination factor NusG [Planctomycetes bacterium]|nr:transcription termination/antitermination factor NusG [Planctomycetota bacterium]